MSSFVQFIGAFNFANVYRPIQEKLFEHFLNIDKEFSNVFEKIRENIKADISSVESMDEIKTTTGASTKHTVCTLMDNLSELQKEEDSLREQVKKEIKERFEMGYSRPMFLTYGLYCTFELLVFGWYDMTKDDVIYSSFASYTLIMWFFAFYFLLCEILKIARIKIRIFMPTHWDVMVGSLIIAFACWLNHIFVSNFEPVFTLPKSVVEYVSASCIALSVIPFVIVMVLTCIHYLMSMNLIKTKSKALSRKHDALRKEKQRIDDVYAIFTNTEGEMGFE